MRMVSRSEVATAGTYAPIMTAETMGPSQLWQAAAKKNLRPLTTDQDDVAERLLLHLHYAIDWKTSWVADRIATYWTEVLPSRVRRATYQADSLESWWSIAARALGAHTPGDPDRRLELANLLAEDSELVLAVFHDKLLARIMRVQIIADAVGMRRNRTRSA